MLLINRDVTERIQNSNRVPTHLEKLENLKNEKINFQAWESPGKKQKQENVQEKSWKFLKIHTLSNFLEQINDHKSHGSIFCHELLS